MKNDYLEDLKDELEESPILKAEMYQILQKYEELYEEYMDDGMAPSEIEAKLGTPKEIVSDIMISRKKKQSFITPRVYFAFLLSVLIYFIIGYTTDIWHPTWLLVFFAPIVYILERL